MDKVKKQNASLALIEKKEIVRLFFPDNSYKDYELFSNIRGARRNGLRPNGFEIININRKLGENEKEWFYTQFKYIFPINCELFKSLETKLIEHKG
jgi:hypothetical protein